LSGRGTGLVPVSVFVHSATLNIDAARRAAVESGRADSTASTVTIETSKVLNWRDAVNSGAARYGGG